ncbi:snRNA-activating protein complex subunit 4 [Caerostris extrusa]|uniref:snRNA-activating protein complex subunit 4 n=1 Tax=Caerostris extrusa TaxID=172846 RepID=A0AAV4XAI2_CAEEX|nr:snRNA-activating protein complex subunit 4 [Caerostris extrusa]
MIEFFPERNAYLCRERYVNMIDPSINHSLWSKEEDLKMIDLIKKYGFGKWAKIAREMPGRTDNMCLTRGRTLRSKLLKKFKVS